MVEVSSANEATVKLTVLYYNIRAVHARHKTSETPFFFNFITFKGHRRPAVFYIDRRPFHSQGNETSSIRLVVANLSRRAQILDGSIAHTAEGGEVVHIAAPLCEIQCVAITIKYTTIISACAATHDIIILIISDNDVGIEACIHVILALGCFYPFAERLPVAGCADGEVVRIR